MAHEGDDGDRGAVNRQALNYAEHFARPENRWTNYSRLSRETLIELALREATGYGLGAAWGVSPTADLLQELAMRLHEAASVGGPNETLVSRMDQASILDDDSLPVGEQNDMEASRTSL